MYVYICIYICMIYIYIYTDTFQIFHGHGSCRVAGNENPATVELAPQSQTPLEQRRDWSHESHDLKKLCGGYHLVI